MDPAVLSDALRSRLGEHFKELARTHGRKLTKAESRLVHKASLQEETPAVSDTVQGIRGTKVTPRPDTSLASVLKRRRTAELGEKEDLNQLGWTLRDVSGQNVGYDLRNGPAGKPVQIEVRKVDRPDARFAMTNNEMSLVLMEPGGYLLAIVVGGGRHAQLMLLDLSRSRVARGQPVRCRPHGDQDQQGAHGLAAAGPPARAERRSTAHSPGEAGHTYSPISDRLGHPGTRPESGVPGLARPAALRHSRTAGAPGRRTPARGGQAMPTGLLRQPSFSADGRLAPGTSLGAYIFLSPG
ncbi:protein NO VEIN domain-containing protein [Streptomyces sp. NPDC003697]